MVSMKIDGYRCFAKGKPQGFDQVFPINIIIGRNNAGKSSLLDVVEYATGHARNSARFKEAPKLHFSKKLTVEDLQQVFNPHAEGNGLPGNHWEYAEQFVGRDVLWWGSFNGNWKCELEKAPHEAATQRWRQLAQALGCPFANTHFYRLGASRDVSPEPWGKPDPREVSWQDNGSRVTGLITHYLYADDLEPELVTRNLLNALNQIVAPTKFSAIESRQSGSHHWEIFLVEDGKGRIRLSDSGAGLKTLLAVLTLVLLRPKFHGHPLGNCVFAFEELENNLHPALQRRLYQFLRARAVDDGARFFLTTHSSVVIDMFEHDDQAGLIHVEHSGQTATATQVATRAHGRHVLDDLDVRASDLLQANCVVWVEGPSDRRYFNQWIREWDSDLREGAHYQCAFYGGKLLSHLCATDDHSEDMREFVSVLALSRHAIIIMDLDRDGIEPPNQTKQRVQLEVERAGGLAWVTAGREIENYIPGAVLKDCADLEPEDLGQFGKIVVELERRTSPLLPVFKRSKVEFAEQVAPHISREAIAGHLDLRDRLDEVVAKIRAWNSMPPREHSD